MNERVKELGLKHTVFKNVHGLDEDGHYSSSYDMAIIASELIKHETIFNYTSIYEDYVEHPDGTNTWIVNTNKLINYYEGVDGLKTGFTNNSGYCITVTAKRGGMRLISVVMGEDNNKIRNQDIISLLNYGFSNYKLETIVDNDDDLGTINIKFGNKEKVKLKLISEAVDLVNILEENDYSYKIETDKLTAPVKMGDIVGKVKVYANGNLVNEYPLTIAENIKKANVFELYRRNLNKFLKGAL